MPRSEVNRAVAFADGIRRDWNNSRRAFRMRNLPNRLRPAALKAEVQRALNVGITSELSAVLIRANGERIDLGVLSRRVVTTAGVGFIANAFLNTVEPENMNYHASGTGNTAEAIGDTALAGEVETRASGTQTSPANGQYRSVGTQTYTANRAIVEHGILSGSSVGTLLDRSVFSVINVQNLDQIQWTYTITFNSGG